MEDRKQETGNRGFKTGQCHGPSPFAGFPFPLFPVSCFSFASPEARPRWTFRVRRTRGPSRRSRRVPSVIVSRNRPASPTNSSALRSGRFGDSSSYGFSSTERAIGLEADPAVPPLPAALPRGAARTTRGPNRLKVKRGRSSSRCPPALPSGLGETLAGAIGLSGSGRTTTRSPSSSMMNCVGPSPFARRRRQRHLHACGHLGDRRKTCPRLAGHDLLVRSGRRRRRTGCPGPRPCSFLPAQLPTRSAPAVRRAKAAANAPPSVP